MSTEFTIHEEDKGRYVVRNEDGREQGRFDYRHDAELFATMMGCDECKQDVEGHARLKWHDHNVLGKQ